MRLYRVDPPEGSGVKPRFVGTNADATKARMAVFEELRPHIRKDSIAITEVDVPTDKSGLLAFLNSLVT